MEEFKLKTKNTFPEIFFKKKEVTDNKRFFDVQLL